jgi:outer membrane protein TolC
VLTKQLKQLSSDTLARMQFLQELTSKLYQGGSLHVKKTDYLRSKLSVNLIKSLDDKISQKQNLSESALLNAMGLSWKDKIRIKDDSLQIPSIDSNMSDLIKKAYKFNPDYTTLNLALDIQDAKIDESKSDYFPHIGINASAQNIKNDYEYGIVNDNNSNSWTLAIGATWSLFNGGKTKYEVEQRKLEKVKLQQTKVLLEQGLALQVKQSFLNMKSSFDQYQTLQEAVFTAKENRELNTRAYQEDMVETKDVIESQLFESYVIGDFYKAQYDHAVAKAKLDLVVGTALKRAKK